MSQPSASQAGSCWWARKRIRLSTVFTGPDYFDVRRHAIQIACNRLNTAPLDLVVDEGTIGNIEVHTENRVYEPRGHLHVSYRTWVTLR